MKLSKEAKIPLYTFKTKETGEEFDAIVPLADYDEYLENNNVDRVWAGKAPKLFSGSMVPSDGFKDLLKQIKKGSGKGNTIETF